MPTSLRWDLLPAVLAHLPAEEADEIGRMDPLDYRTHADAYAAARRYAATTIDERLLREFVLGLLLYLESDPAEPQEVADRIKLRRLHRSPSGDAGT